MWGARDLGTLIALLRECKGASALARVSLEEKIFSKGREESLHRASTTASARYVPCVWTVNRNASVYMK